MHGKCSCRKVGPGFNSQPGILRGLFADYDFDKQRNNILYILQYRANKFTQKEEYFKVFL